MNRSDVYQSVTDRIVEALEQGTAPWRKPWIGGGPVNVRNGRHYRGINIFLLEITSAVKGYNDPRWGTFKACMEAAVAHARREGRTIEERSSKKGTIYLENGELFAGGVRKGERATHVILWKPVVKKEAGDDSQDSENRYMLLRSYAVFNANQCDEMPPRDEGFAHDPIERAEEIVRGFVPIGPVIQFGGGSAHYVPSRDLVACPPLDQFERVEGYYSTLYHELVHSTGHESRLDRLEKTGFGSGPYAKEELVAEMGAAMLCGMAGIDNLDQSAAYVKGWLSALRDDPKLVVQAAANAQRASDLILGQTFAESAAETELIAA